MLLILLLLSLAFSSASSDVPVKAEVNKMTESQLLVYLAASLEQYKLTKHETVHPKNKYSKYFFEALGELIARCSKKKLVGIERSLKKWLISQTSRLSFKRVGDFNKFTRLLSVPVGVQNVFGFSLGTLLLDLDKKFKRITITGYKSYFVNLSDIPNCSFCNVIKSEMLQKIDNRRHFFPDFTSKKDIEKALTVGIKTSHEEGLEECDADKLLGYYLYAQAKRFILNEEKTLAMLRRVLIPLQK
jgi:hypothetical protein